MRNSRFPQFSRQPHYTADAIAKARGTLGNVVPRSVIAERFLHRQVPAITDRGYNCADTHDHRSRLQLRRHPRSPIAATTAQTPTITDRGYSGADTHDHRSRPQLADTRASAAHHAANVMTVTPSPPSLASPVRAVLTRLCLATISRTTWRKTPVPLPCTMRTKGRPARKASFR